MRVEEFARHDSVGPRLASLTLRSRAEGILERCTHPHVESFIAVDSRDPQHLLAASMVVINGETRSYPYVSFDGGKSWTLGQVTDNAGVVNEADPIVYFSYSGVAFFPAWQ